MTQTWKLCSACKRPIPLGGDYWACSVSTCNRARSPFVFCSLGCWDSHVPVMNHRDAWADERTAPLELVPDPPEGAAPTSPSAPRKVTVRPIEASTPLNEEDILVVASRLRNYVKNRSGMNTSGEVYDILSREIRRMTDRAILTAQRQGRKTVMARDFES